MHLAGSRNILVGGNLKSLSYRLCHLQHDLENKYQSKLHLKQNSIHINKCSDGRKPCLSVLLPLQKQNINKALTHPKETTADRGQMTVGHSVEKSRHRANQTTQSVPPTTSSPSSNERQQDWGEKDLQVNSEPSFKREVLKATRMVTPHFSSKHQEISNAPV